MGTIVLSLRKSSRSTPRDIAQTNRYGQTGSGKSHTMVSYISLATAGRADGLTDWCGG